MSPLRGALRALPLRAGVRVATGLWLAGFGALPGHAAEEGAPLPITPQAFGAQCNSRGAPGDGADDTRAVQAAIEAAERSGRSLKIMGAPAGQMCRVTAPLTVRSHITIDGDYCQPYASPSSISPTPGAGSWLYFDHTGAGIYADSGRPNVQVSGMVFKNICTFRNQPPYPRSGDWAPLDNDYDFKIMQDDTSIEHVITLNPTRAISIRGRYLIDDLKGSPFVVGIDSENSQDTPRIVNVQFWPFAGINQSVEAYKRATLDGLRMARADNPDIENVTVVGSKDCIHFVQTKDGSTNKFHGANIDCDLFGQSGIHVDGVTGMTAQISNFTAQGNDPSSINSLNIAGRYNHFHIANFRSTATGQQAIGVNGPDNEVAVLNVTIETWGRVDPHGTTPAIYVDAGSRVEIGGALNFANGPTGTVGPLVYGGKGQVFRSMPTQVH